MFEICTASIIWWQLFFLLVKEQIRIRVQETTIPRNTLAICLDAKLSGLWLKTDSCEIVSQSPWRSDSWQTGGNWSCRFSRGAKHKGGTPNIVLLLPRGVDRGSQRAVLQPWANLMLDGRMWRAEQSSFLKPRVAMVKAEHVKMALRTGLCVCNCACEDVASLIISFGDNKWRSGCFFHFISMITSTYASMERRCGNGTPSCAC